ncbi:MAG: GAF domain-containing protein [Acidimicrobiales bacterium]|nr:GAF domain-containing protein [Acidimicrobiales bacterium]
MPDDVDTLATQLGPVLDSTVRSLRRIYSAASVSVALTSEDGASLSFVAADGEAAASVVGLTISVDTGIAGWVAMSQTPMAVGDVTRDPRFARDVAEQIGYIPQSILAAPIPGPDGALGVIEVLDADASRRGDLGTLSLTGSLLAALLAHSSESQLDPALLHRLVRVAATGPAAVALAARLLDVVIETGEQGD